MDTWHIYNKGDNVLFRDNADRIFFNNKFAAICHTNSVEALALCELSTHFHSIACIGEEYQVKAVTNDLKVSYGLYYRHKYGATLGNNFKIKCDRLIGRNIIIDKLVYVMTNPVHHYITESPYTWQFSSANYIFTQEYLPPNFRKAITDNTTALGNITIRKQREMLGRDILPDSWMADPDGFILPNSFINVPKVRTYFNSSYRQFRYLVDTSVKDARQKNINANKQAVFCDGLDDDKVCAIIDQFAVSCGHQSFHFLTEKELMQIVSKLLSRGVPFEQYRRCLWLPKGDE